MVIISTGSGVSGLNPGSVSSCVTSGKLCTYSVPLLPKGDDNTDLSLWQRLNVF